MSENLPDHGLKPPLITCQRIVVNVKSLSLQVYGDIKRYIEQMGYAHL